jgi:hypothetical protein
MNYQQISAAVQLATDLIFTNLALSRDRHIQVDVAVSGVEVYVRS